jgi:DNA-binding NtrC family response regulator
MSRSACPSTAPAADSQGITAESEATLEWVFPQQLRTRLSGRDSFTFGRSSDAAVVIEGAEVSRLHAEIRRDGPIWILRDLGSRNGTFVGGRRIDEAPLAPGSVVRLGDALGIFSLQSERDDDEGFGELSPGFFGGARLRRLLAGCVKVAQSEMPMILEAETGSGKERLAHWVHHVSGRPGRLVSLNCAALPESLAEAELFGYRKGAFTGATTESLGHFRTAESGTLVLDEILDLPRVLQAKLLRALEQREVTPLGESLARPVDVRVIAASQAPLERAVESGAFRADLWARLNGLTVTIPPLRERPEDIVPLFLRFLSERFGGRPPQVDVRQLEAISLYEWPLNVRELELLSRRLATMHGFTSVLRRSHLPERVLKRAGGAANSSPPGPNPDDYSRFLDALRVHRGVVARAAEAAGISRMRAYRLMKEHDFDLDNLRSAEREPSE